MHRAIQVITLVPDFFASNWIAMLFARDWRTRLVGEAGNIAELAALLHNPHVVDAVLIDTHVLDENGAQQRFAALAAEHPKVRFLWICETPNLAIFDWIPPAQMLGLMCKAEIRHSLAWALVIGMEKMVVSPAVRTLVFHTGLMLPLQTAVLDGQVSFNQLNDHDLEVARLALIFSMERRDLSDELGISEDWSYGLVSSLYKKLGLEEVLSGEMSLTELLGPHSLIEDHIHEMIQQLGTSKRARDMETLAFHLLTMPNVQPLYS